ncbi:hypothetical protein WG66_007480 [Moniliophthora roreri]|nr:hypothetical protein WG66_007480 [Moniliophthora roreri]
MAFSFHKPSGPSYFDGIHNVWSNAPSAMCFHHQHAINTLSYSPFTTLSPPRLQSLSSTVLDGTQTSDPPLAYPPTHILDIIIGKASQSCGFSNANRSSMKQAVGWLHPTTPLPTFGVDFKIIYPEHSGDGGSTRDSKAGLMLTKPLRRTRSGSRRTGAENLPHCQSSTEQTWFRNILPWLGV